MRTVRRPRFSRQMVRVESRVFRSIILNSTQLNFIDEMVKTTTDSLVYHVEFLTD